MKTLYLIRHAKAGAHSPLHDYERELTQSGKHDAANMATLLATRISSADLIVTSPAARTLATAKAMALGLHYPENKIIADRKLYNAEDKALLRVLQGVDDQHQAVILVGHNPGITEFANSIFGTMIISMATCGIAAGSLSIDSWKELSWGDGVFGFYEEPG